MREPDYFIQFVMECMTRVNKLVCYEQGPPGMHHSLVWPEMGEASWRDAVESRVKNRESRIKAQFCEPNAERDWIFLCQRRSM